MQKYLAKECPNKKKLNIVLEEIKKELLSKTLIEAAKAGQFKCLQLLLENEWSCADPDAEYNGETALSVAHKNGHTDCYNLLIDYGADGSVEESISTTPVSFAGSASSSSSSSSAPSPHLFIDGGDQSIF